MSWLINDELGFYAEREQRIPNRELYAKFVISGAEIEASRRDRGAFVRAMEAEYRQAQEQMRNDMRRQEAAYIEREYRARFREREGT